MPYDPATSSSPIEVQDRDDRDRAESYIRERGPLHLLEAVYCDPCKAKVITFLQLSPNLIFLPGRLLSHHYNLLARSAKVF